MDQPPRTHLHHPRPRSLRSGSDGDLSSKPFSDSSSDLIISSDRLGPRLAVNPHARMPFDAGWAERANTAAEPAFAIALLVHPDSVLTARSLAAVNKSRLDPNREFFCIAAASSAQVSCRGSQ